MPRFQTKADKAWDARFAREKKLKGYLIEIRKTLGLHDRASARDVIKEVKRLVAERNEANGKEQEPESGDG